ncbi:UNVERIFIED_ORG: putative membrane protein [Heyndrickxia coagulans]
MNHYDHIHPSNYFGAGIFPQLLIFLPFAMLLILYFYAVIFSSRRFKPWPFYRTVCFTLSIFFVAISITGPLANHALVDFKAHMICHLFLGMLAPLLMVLAAPMTLVLRTISIPNGRRLTRVLRSWPSRLYTHPVVASFLDIGGLWVLYTTQLYAFMHESMLLHLFIHFHVFVAGYLFTVSMISFDPMPHQVSFLYRAIVLIIALAGHDILSKYIYANPPVGIPLEDAKVGGMIMYYGGDAIDMVIIYILCLQWFKAARPRSSAISNGKYVD